MGMKAFPNFEGKSKVDDNSPKKSELGKDKVHQKNADDTPKMSLAQSEVHLKMADDAPKMDLAQSEVHLKMADDAPKMGLAQLEVAPDKLKKGVNKANNIMKVLEGKSKVDDASPEKLGRGKEK